MTSLLVLCPKRAPLEWWFAGKTVPRDVGIVCALYPTDRRAIALLKKLCRGVAVVFVGDMDPYGIVLYGFVSAARRIAM
jgi:hypothetical protein